METGSPAKLGWETEQEQRLRRVFLDAFSRGKVQSSLWLDAVLTSKGPPVIAGWKGAKGENNKVNVRKKTITARDGMNMALQ